MRRILPVALLLARAGVAAEAAESSWLAVQAPGEWQELSEAGLPPPTVANPWYALTIDAQSLTITPVTSTRKPEVTASLSALQEPGPEDSPPPPPELPTLYALALPPGAAFGFQPGGDAPVTTRPGRYRSALDAPLAITPRMIAPATVGGKTWALVTDVRARPDGKPLDGSVSLLARDVYGEELMVVPPVMGLAFSDYQILWVGQLTPRSTVDAVVRRTWITGQIDYVLSVAGVIAVATVDPESPVRAFSSGVENYLSVVRPTEQPHDPDETFAPAVSIAIDEEWNAAYDKAAAAGLPAQMLERTFTFRGAPVRLTVDYLPMWPDPYAGPDSISPTSWWLGRALVKVTYGGKTQTLIGLPRLDDGGFTFSLGTVGNEVAIYVTHQPHYNNDFEYRWVRRESDGRFLRTYIYKSQGC
jgi:hypothetical protein